MVLHHFHIFFFHKPRTLHLPHLLLSFQRAFPDIFSFAHWWLPGITPLSFSYAQYEVRKVTQPSCALKPRVSTYVCCLAVLEAVHLKNQFQAFSTSRRPLYLWSWKMSSGGTYWNTVLVPPVLVLDRSLTHHGHQHFWLLKPMLMLFAVLQGVHKGLILHPLASDWADPVSSLDCHNPYLPWQCAAFFRYVHYPVDPMACAWTLQTFLGPCSGRAEML